MERTLREGFFAEVKQDPYAHMMFKMHLRAWVLGYECALKLAGLPLEISYDEMEELAAEQLTEEQKRGDAAAIIAMAAAAPVLHKARQ